MPLAPRPTARDPPTTAAPTSSSAVSATRSPPRPPLRTGVAPKRSQEPTPPPAQSPPSLLPALCPLLPHDSPCRPHRRAPRLRPTGGATAPDPIALLRTPPPPTTSPAPALSSGCGYTEDPPANPPRRAGTPALCHPHTGWATPQSPLHSVTCRTARPGGAGCGAAPYRDVQEEIHGGTVAGKGRRAVPTTDPSPVTCHQRSHGMGTARG